MKKSILLFVVTSLLISCKSKEEGIHEITIGTFSMAIDYSPFYVAKHFKWFEESELLKDKKIIYKQFNDRDSFAASLNGDQPCVIFAAEPPIIITRAQGIDVKVVALSCVLQQEILIKSDLHITNPMNLKGHSIAVLAGTSSHYGLYKILSNNHIAVSEVDVRFLEPEIARVAFEKGSIDAWAVWPPFVEEQQIRGSGKILNGGDAFIQSVVAMPSEMLMHEPELSKEILAIINKAKAWIENNTQEAICIIAKELDLDADIVELAWKKHLWSAQLNDRFIQDIQDKAEFLAKEKLTRNGTVVQVKDLIYTYDQN